MSTSTTTTTSRSRRNRAAVALAAATVLAAAALAGCGSSGGGGQADATTTTAGNAETTTTASGTTGDKTTTTTGTSAGATTTTQDNSGDPGKEGTETGALDTLPSGTHYGYFGGVEDGKVEGQDVQVLLFDKAELLTGQAAIDAATAHGDTADNDYYIVNDNQTLRRLAVVPDGQVTTLVDGSMDQTPSSVDEVAKDVHLFKILVQNVRGISTISSIEAVYQP